MEISILIYRVLRNSTKEVKDTKINAKKLLYTLKKEYNNFKNDYGRHGVGIRVSALFSSYNIVFERIFNPETDRRCKYNLKIHEEKCNTKNIKDKIETFVKNFLKEVYYE